MTAQRDGASTGQSRAAPVRVFLVDDSPGFCSLVRAIFAREPGLEIVASSASAEDAIERLREVAVDVVLLDIELGGMDGLTAIPHVQRAAPGTSILIVSLSAERNSAISANALSLGADDYLHKPVRTDEVASFRDALVAKVKGLAAKTAGRRQSGVGEQAPADAPPMVPAVSTASAAGATQRLATPGNPIRVMIVDDSLAFSKLLAALLARDPMILVVAVAASSQQAIGILAAIHVDVIILDIEMPGMSGIDALPRLLDAAPRVRVIMASILTQENAAISLKALALGASDYIPKPVGPSDTAIDGVFFRDLVGKVKALVKAGADAQPAVIQLRSPGAMPPAVLAIGCSTGGPQALTTLLQMMRWPIGVPVVVTQHMPSTFTRAFAETLAAKSGMPCKEGQHGEVLKPDHVYVAPGGEHMLIEAGPGGLAIKLTQDPPENFCRPSVDPMLRSVAHAAGGRVLAVILTGMGADGAAGARALVDAGGTVLAQDQATSVVWGMPGAVAGAGLCSAVLPLAGLAQEIDRLVRRTAVHSAAGVAASTGGGEEAGRLR